MECEGSLPCPQETATGTYPQLDESSPDPHPISLKSILILSFYLRLCLPSGLFISGFTTKAFLNFSSPHARYMPRLSHHPWFDHPITSGEKYNLWNY
jgi:hypothetical protein